MVKRHIKKLALLLLAACLLAGTVSTTARAAMDTGRYKVICKGITLVGYTKYRSKAGSNRVRHLGSAPEYLCCSSFVSWCYTKAKVKRIDYSTWDFCHSTKFREISARQLKPGDIGLIHNDRRTGNHVAIYIGKRAGERLWLHCTGHAGRNGVVISTDGRLKVYYRYRGFKD